MVPPAKGRGAGTSVKKTVGRGDAWKSDWYCCKGCVNNHGDKWWNHGTDSSCTKCHIAKGSSFGGVRRSGQPAPSKRVASVQDKKLADAQAEIVRLRKLADGQTKLAEGRLAENIKLKQEAPPAASDGMDLENQSASAASLGAEERKRADELAQKIKVYTKDPDAAELVAKLQAELDGLRKQIMDAKPLDAKVRAARSEVKRIEAAVAKHQEKVSKQQALIAEQTAELDKLRQQHSKATGDLVTAKAKLQELLVEEVSAGPAGGGAPPGMVVEVPADLLSQHLALAGVQNVEQNNELAKKLEKIIPAIAKVTPASGDGAAAPPAAAPEPAAAAEGAKVDLVATASESELRQTLEVIYPTESGVQIPTDVESMRQLVAKAAACPLLRQTGGGAGQAPKA